MYEEQGETKSALVKVVLCGKCVKKLMWKRQKEKEARERRGEENEGQKLGEITREREKNNESMADSHRRHRNSRSRSPVPRESKSHTLDRRRSTHASHEKS